MKPVPLSFTVMKACPSSSIEYPSVARYPVVFLSLIIVCFTGLGISAQTQPHTTDFAQLSQQAQSAYSSGRFEDAAKLYGQAVKLRPSWVEGWGYRASALYELKRFAEAREAYRRTTVLTPNNGPSWAFLGLCDFELRDYRNAFDHFVKARQLGLGGAQGLISNIAYHMALLWNTAGQFELAMKELAFLADKGNDSPDVVEATGLAVLRMPVFPYEIPVTKREVVISAGKAGWAQNAHHNDDARQLYEELMTAYPKEPNVHFAYAAFLATLDQEAATAQYEKEVAVNPASVPARVQAAFLYLKMGELDKAEAHARRATELDPQNYSPHYLLGRILVEMDRTADAIHELEVAVRLSPSNANVHLSLAQAYQRAGNKSQAEQEMLVFKELDDQRKKQESDLRIN